MLIGLYALVVCLSLAYPAYIDDVFYTMYQSRIGFDGWVNIRFKAECGNMTFEMPLALLAAKTIAWGTHALSDNFYIMRGFAIAFWMITIAYTVWFVGKCITPNTSKLLLLAGTIAFIGLGNLPLSTLITRPEPNIFSLIVFYTSIPYLVMKYPQVSQRFKLLFACAFFLLTSWFFISHIKAFFYTPLIVIALLYCRTWDRRLSLLLAAATLITFVSAAEYWQFMQNCPESRAITTKVSYKYPSPALLLHHPSRFLELVAVNLMNYQSYFNDLLFYNIGLLPPAPAGFAQGAANTLIFAFMHGVLCFAVVGGVFVGVHSIRHQWWRKEPTAIIIQSLLLALFAQTAMQSKHSFYGAVLIWLTIVWVAVLTTHYLTRHFALRALWGNIVIACGMSLACISLAILLIIYAPLTISALQNPTPSGRMFGHYALINAWGYYEREERILHAASQCGISADSSTKHLSLDIYTYLPFRQTYQPSSVTFKFQKSRNPKEFLKFLAQKNSDGLVRRCASLPKGVRQLAKEHEGICCISREQIHRASPRPSTDP